MSGPSELSFGIRRRWKPGVTASGSKTVSGNKYGDRVRLQAVENRSDYRRAGKYFLVSLTRSASGKGFSKKGI